MLHQFINRLTHQVEPIVECLIRGKVREPGKQIFFGECMYLFDAKIALIRSAEQIYGKLLLISEDRCSVITEPLTVELQ